MGGPILEAALFAMKPLREDIVEGLERAPAALIGLLRGDNVGKRMVRVVPGVV